jgi:hypothetical protein
MYKWIGLALIAIVLYCVSIMKGSAGCYKTKEPEPGRHEFPPGWEAFCQGDRDCSGKEYVYEYVPAGPYECVAISEEESGNIDCCGRSINQEIWRDTIRCRTEADGSCKMHHTDLVLIGTRTLPGRVACGESCTE